jgi:uncharacterized protein
VVISCVNQVGVEANIASERHLCYVSGFNPILAKNFVKYRKENGPFKTREDFLKVPRLSPKIFEQCAGFLRLASSDNPLDKSAVHPEAYHVVEKMAQDLGVSVSALFTDKSLKKQLTLTGYVTETIGLPTLEDIIKELEEPGRDPRSIFKAVNFASGLQSLKDIKVGLCLPGIVNSLTDFGAFVDLGIPVKGLIHKSKMSKTFVRHPSDVVKIGEEVNVTVIEIDVNKKRLQLSLINTHEQRHGPPPIRFQSPKVNQATIPLNNPFESLKELKSS